MGRQHTAAVGNIICLQSSCCDHSNIEKLVKTLCHFIYINQALNIMETLEAHDSGGDGKVLLQSMEHSLSAHLQ